MTLERGSLPAQGYIPSLSADDRKRIAVGLEQRAAEIERTDAVGAAALRRIAAEWRQGRKT